MKKTAIIIAAVLVVLGLALGAGAYLLAGSDTSVFGGGAYTEKTYPVEGTFRNIEISASETDVVFLPASDGRCRVDCTQRERCGFEVVNDAGTLRITEHDERRWFDHISLFSKNLSMTVFLPESAYDALTVRNSTGDVTVPADFSFAQAEIKVSTGEVDCRAAVSGLLEIRSSTGDLSLSGVRAGELRLTVSTGRIRAEKIDCGGTLSVDVSTGRTTLTDVNCRSLVSRGDTGDLTLENVTAADAFDIQRDTGKVKFVNSDASEITVKTSTGDVTGTLRSEKVFIVRTSTGDIDVPETLSGGKCQITTSTGDVRISLSD